MNPLTLIELAQSAGFRGWKVSSPGEKTRPVNHGALGHRVTVEGSRVFAAFVFTEGGREVRISSEWNPWDKTPEADILLNGETFPGTVKTKFHWGIFGCRLGVVFQIEEVKWRFDGTLGKKTKADK